MSILRTVPRIAAICSTALALSTHAAHAAQPAHNGLTQAAGAGGCIMIQALEGCAAANADALDLAGGMAITPDASLVLVPARNGDRLTAFRREALSGALSPLAGDAGCVAAHGDATCQEGHALLGAVGVAVSPDGHNAYAIAQRSDAVTAFRIGPGDLTQLPDPSGCVSEKGTVGACQDGHGLVLPRDVDVSPDGKNVYVAARGDDIPTSVEAITGFERDAKSGAITQLGGPGGCVSSTGQDGFCDDADGIVDVVDIEVTPDGKQVVAAAPGSDGVVAFSRDADGRLSQSMASGRCANAEGSFQCLEAPELAGAHHVAVTADGRSIYVAAATAIVRLARDPVTGKLSRPPVGLRCWGPAPGCQPVPGLVAPGAVRVTTNGDGLYVGAIVGPNVIASVPGVLGFTRDGATGGLAPVSVQAGGCVAASATLGCTDGRGIVSVPELAIAPGSRWVYAASRYGIAALRRQVSIIGSATGP